MRSSAQQAVEWLLMNPPKSDRFLEAAKEYSNDNDCENEAANVESIEENKHDEKSGYMEEVDFVVGMGTARRAAANEVVNLIRVLLVPGSGWAAVIEHELEYVLTNATIDISKYKKIESQGFNKKKLMFKGVSQVIAALAVVSTGWEEICVGGRVVVSDSDRGATGTVVDIEQNVLCPEKDCRVRVIFDESRVASTMPISDLHPVQDIAAPMSTIDRMCFHIVRLSIESCNCSSLIMSLEEKNTVRNASMKFHLSTFRSFILRALHTALQCDRCVSLVRQKELLPLLLRGAMLPSPEKRLTTLRRLEYCNGIITNRLYDMMLSGVIFADPHVPTEEVKGVMSDSEKEIAANLMAFAPVQSIDLCVKALEIKQDNMEMAADWLLTHGLTFINAGGLDEQRPTVHSDPRYETAKELAMMFGLPPSLCTKALRLWRDNKEAAADWLLTNGKTFQVGEEKPSMELLPFISSKERDEGSIQDTEEKVDSEQVETEEKNEETVTFHNQDERELQVLRNDEGFIIMQSQTIGYSQNFYCGRHLGWDAIENSDGQCGPHNGPQCASCARFQEKFSQKKEEFFERCNFTPIFEIGEFVTVQNGASTLHCGVIIGNEGNVFHIQCNSDGKVRRFLAGKLRSTSCHDENGQSHRLSCYQNLLEDPYNLALRRRDQALIQSKRNWALRNDDRAENSTGGLSELLGEYILHEDEAGALLRELNANDLSDSSIGESITSMNESVSNRNHAKPITKCSIESLDDMSEDDDVSKFPVVPEAEFRYLVAEEQKLTRTMLYENHDKPVCTSRLSKRMLVAVKITEKPRPSWRWAVLSQKPLLGYETLRVRIFDFETGKRTEKQVDLNCTRCPVKLFGDPLFDGTSLLERACSIQESISVAYARLSVARFLAALNNGSKYEKDSVLFQRHDPAHPRRIVPSYKGKLEVETFAAKLLGAKTETETNWMSPFIKLVKIFVASQGEFFRRSGCIQARLMQQHMETAGNGKNCTGKRLPEPETVMHQISRVLGNMLTVEERLAYALLEEATVNLQTSTTPGSVNKKMLDLVTRSSLHPYWPLTNESGEVKLDASGSYWIVFDSRSHTLSNGTLEFFRDREFRHLVGVASGPPPWKPIVVRLTDAVIFWRFTSKAREEISLWGWRFQVRPLKGQRWKSEEEALKGSSLEWACWVLKLLLEKASAGQSGQIFDALVTYLQARGAPGKRKVTLLLTRLLRAKWMRENPPNLKLLKPIERSIMRWCTAERGRLFLPRTVQELVGLIIAAKELILKEDLNDSIPDEDDLSSTLVLVSEIADFFLNRRKELPEAVLSQAIMDVFKAPGKREWMEQPKAPKWFASMSWQMRLLVVNGINANFSTWLRNSTIVLFWKYCSEMERKMEVEGNVKELKDKLKVNNCLDGRMIFFEDVSAKEVVRPLQFTKNTLQKWQCCKIKRHDPKSGCVILKTPFLDRFENGRFFIPKKDFHGILRKEALEFAYYIHCGGDENLDFSHAPQKTSTLKEQDACTRQLSRKIRGSWIRKDADVCVFLVARAKRARAYSTSQEQIEAESKTNSDILWSNVKNGFHLWEKWTNGMDSELVSLAETRAKSFEAAGMAIDQKWGHDRSEPNIFDLHPNCMMKLSDKEKSNFPNLSNFEEANAKKNLLQCPASDGGAGVLLRLRFAILRIWNGLLSRVLPLIDVDSKVQGSLGFKLMKLKGHIFMATKENLLEEAITKTKGPSLGGIQISLDQHAAFQSKELGESSVESSRCIFVQALDKLYDVKPEKLRGINGTQHFKVKISGQDGVDAGGLYRDTLTSFLEDLFSPTLNLFLKSPNAKQGEGLYRNCYIPNSRERNPKSLVAFRVVGRLAGIALRTKIHLPFQLPRFIWERLLGENVTNKLESLSTFDFSSARLLRDIRDCSSATNFNDFFEGNVPVPYPVRKKYVEQELNARLFEFDLQLDAMKRGLFEIVPARALKLYSGSQLEVLVAGEEEIDIRVLKKHTKYEGFIGGEKNPFVQRFWKAFRMLSQQERSKFIRFAYGRSRLPSGIWERPFKLTRRGGGDETLPVAHTCFFALEMPEYSSTEKMVHALRICCTHGLNGFLLA
eukprot:g3112.t1